MTNFVAIISLVGVAMGLVGMVIAWWLLGTFFGGENE